MRYLTFILLVCPLLAQTKPPFDLVLKGGHVIDPKNNTTQEMRLLTTPIYEYADEKTKEYAGSVFALSTNGTNPDLLVLLEPREAGGKTKWLIAPARMTSGGVTLSFRDKKVWDCPFVSPREAPFATWTFFQIPRKALSEE